MNRREPDSVEQIGHSLIQHGPLNQRVYLMKANASDAPRLPDYMEDLALQNGYTKIFAKIPVTLEPAFLEKGYECEGRIPEFYRGRTDAAFLGKFLRHERRHCRQGLRVDTIVATALKTRNKARSEMPQGYRLREANENDARELARIYADTFDTYPFPISDPQYLRDTMRSHVRYFVAEHEGAIAAVASSEMDEESGNAEMTDFATLAAHRGQGLSAHLLAHMEVAMQAAGIDTLYTIARALSPAMNITFARCGYKYGGTLINNTQISGSIESMNLWHKALGQHSVPTD